MLRPRLVGRGERTRTSGLFVPNEARYQAALHPDASRPDNYTEAPRRATNHPRAPPDLGVIARSL